MVRLPTQSNPPLPPRETLPTMYDLPSENKEEPGLPDEFHGLQQSILRDGFKPTNYNLAEIFIGADINIYYDIHHLQWYKRPDWFAAVGVSRLYEGHDLRLSYVIWQELVSPFVMVELLSPGTEEEDLGETEQKRGNPPTKWQVYEQILRVPYYIVFSRYNNEMLAFRLVAGVYEAAQLIDSRLLIPQLGLSLGLWQGSYAGIERLWLRWFTTEGDLIPLPTEEAIVAEQRATLAEQRATIAEERATIAEQQISATEERATLAEEKAERLAARLRELGIDPNKLE
jgi:Uma2 family endonuclease